MKLILLFIILPFNISPRIFLKQRRSHHPIGSSHHNQSIGRFANNIYKGKWRSKSKLQNNYLESKEGMIYFSLNKSFRELNQYVLILEFYEGHYKENRFMISFQYFSKEDFNVKDLKIEDSIGKLKSFYNFDSLKDSKTCNMITQLSLSDKDGFQKSFGRNSFYDNHLHGTMISEECNIDISFEVYPIQIDFFSVLSFLLINILAISFHMQPILKIIKTNDFRSIQGINETVLLMSIIIDFTLIALNTTYSM